MNTTSKYVVGLVTAAAAGAVIGMLLAPEKGKDLQRKLSTGTRDWLSELGSLLDLGRDVVNKVKTKGQQTVDDLSAPVNEVSQN